MTASTNFSNGTIVSATWLNEIDAAVFDDIANVKRHGALGDGVTDDSAAVQQALSTGSSVYFPSGTYLVNNLTFASNQKALFSDGNAILAKNANGPILTISGDDVSVYGIKFRGDASSPTYTGANVSITGDNCLLRDCGSRWAYAEAVISTGQRTRILGSNDIYQTAASGASDFDIVISDSGTATLYHVIDGIQSTQATGGIKLLDTGGAHIANCQFGKLTITASNIASPPSGVGSNSIASSRITGAVVVEVSNTSFSTNAVSGASITFSANTSQHAFSESNALAVATTITDNSNNSNIVDQRLLYLQTWTTSWTGSSSNPAIGNGTLTTRYTKRGKEVTANISILAGSTTTFGSGYWTFTLPVNAHDTIVQYGAGRAVVGGTQYNVTARTATGGSSNCLLSVNNSGNDVGAANPGAWANGDKLEFTIRYWTN